MLYGRSQPPVRCDFNSSQGRHRKSRSTTTHCNTCIARCWPAPRAEKIMEDTRAKSPAMPIIMELRAVLARCDGRMVYEDVPHEHHKDHAMQQDQFQFICTLSCAQKPPEELHLKVQKLAGGRGPTPKGVPSGRTSLLGMYQTPYLFCIPLSLSRQSLSSPRQLKKPKPKPGECLANVLAENFIVVMSN